MHIQHTAEPLLLLPLSTLLLLLTDRRGTSASRCSVLCAHLTGQ
jgi:hypothetical protein